MNVATSVTIRGSNFVPGKYFAVGVESAPYAHVKRKNRRTLLLVLCKFLVVVFELEKTNYFVIVSTGGIRSSIKIDGIFNFNIHRWSTPNTNHIIFAKFWGHWG